MARYSLHPQAIKLVNTTWKPSLDGKKLAKNVWDSLFDLTDLKVGTASKKIVESFGIKDPIENIAFELVFNALLNASKKLIKEHHEGKLDTIKDLASTNTKLKGDVTKAIESLEMSIDPSFFSNPKGFNFLPFYKFIFYNWLQESIGFDEKEAKNLAKKIPSKFAEELIQEWNNNGERYEEIKAHFDSNPFSENSKIETDRDTYYKKIEEEFTDLIFTETKLWLNTTYILPRFTIHKRNLPDEKNDYLDADKDPFKTIHFEGKHIHNYINNYFLKNKKAFNLKTEESRLLLLLGQPGQGKTSFCLKVINDVLNDLHYNKELIFLRLKDLRSPREFLLHPFQELEEHFKKFHFDFDNALLVLDGLDELYISTGLTNNEITEFILQVSRIITQKPKLHLIITSRFHYINLKKLAKDKALILSLTPLNFEEQKQWLRSYIKIYPDCRLKEAKLLEINASDNDSKYKEVKELLNQPILLYLIAKANFDITEGHNRSIIYENLFNALIKRNWEKDGQLEKFENFEKEDFRNFIGAIALKIYQSNNGFIYKSDLIKIDLIKEFVDENFKAEFKQLEDALKDVLISFYFKNIDDSRIQEEEKKKNDYAIEFFHKSLQEYLVAERIWKLILEKFLDKNRKGKYLINDWESALKLIWELGSVKGLTKEVSQYLREIISNFPDSSIKEELFQRLIRFFSDIIQNGFIYSYQSSNDSFSPFLKGAESFYIYYTIISSISIIPSENITSQFTELILIKQRVNPDFINLDGVNLGGANLDGADLYETNLNEAYLVGAYFGGAILEGANLEGAILTGANLEGAILTGANLEGAILEGASLERASLEGASLNGASLNGANLIGADLDKAFLIETNLRGANLMEARLEKAILLEADLKGASLQRTNFEGADLEGANLAGANLYMTIFQKTNLQRARLQGASLYNTNFEGADLGGANLEGAKLVGVEKLIKVDNIKSSIGIPKNILDELLKVRPDLSV